MFIKRIIFFATLVLAICGCDKDEASPEKLELLTVFVGTTQINLEGPVTAGLPLDRSVTLNFSQPLDPTSATTALVLKKAGQTVNTSISFLSGARTVVMFPAAALESKTTYTIQISDQLMSESGAHAGAATISFITVLQDLQTSSFTIGQENAAGNGNMTGVPVNFTASVRFPVPLDAATLPGAFTLTGSEAPALNHTLSLDGLTLDLSSISPLDDFTKYELSLSGSIKGSLGEAFSGLTKIFYTGADNVPDFPVISDEALLTKVQQRTFNYFWDFAQPASGMARERNTSGDLITSGGSGFGVMALIVGMERNFITRQQGLQRMEKMLGFLESADRFHGAWPHWINGNTGDVIPFSANDNGGDLVETSFLIQGLIAFRQYLDGGVAQEQAIIDRINTLWQTVEWDWYRREGQNVLYWHWSATLGWTMNHAVRGWNECLITYMLAASSPTHSIPTEVYTQGWASNGGIQNGNTYEGVVLPLGSDHGGPLFFTHYSFMGLDPRSLQDAYANYWTQNVNHTTINYKYCVRNPRNFVAYSDACWGLTASDNNTGYSAHSPTNDLGVITPTAALSSFPYTPEASMKAMKFFYYSLGDRLWGEYGFYDAFNITEGWTADSYLAIDQGPIVVMIENYRTGLVWELFMSAPEIQNGITKLGFTD